VCLVSGLGARCEEKQRPLSPVPASTKFQPQAFKTSEQKPRGKSCCCTQDGWALVFANRKNMTKIKSFLNEPRHHAACAHNATGCNGLSWDLVFRVLPRAVHLAVDRLPPPPSGMGPTARHRQASPQGAELTARYITFFKLGGRASVPAAAPKVAGHSFLPTERTPRWPTAVLQKEATAFGSGINKCRHTGG
jgi:hypothetical protein